jgi:hypothetical protein
MTGPHVAFDTDLFETEQADDDIDNGALGKDLAQWLHEGLTRRTHVTSHRDPLEEDWGWTFGVVVSGTKFWVNIWDAPSWIVGLEVRPGLLGMFRKAQTARAVSALRTMVSDMLATPDFKNVAWYDHWPDERCR